MRALIECRQLIVSLTLVVAAVLTAVSCQPGGRRAPESRTPATMPAAAAGDDMQLDMATVRRMGFTFAASPSKRRSAEEVAARSKSCVACHTESDARTMHNSDVGIACTDCHGGRSDVAVPAGIARTATEYEGLKRAAHPTPRVPDLWKTSANPGVPASATLREGPDYIRFVNPGDLRADRVACYSCHPDEVKQVEKSMMAHGAMLWSAALYNNGAINLKRPVYGESYAPDGTPREMINRPLPTTRQVAMEGILPDLWPLPRWEITQPGNILRVFERGGERRPIIGIPDRKEEPGRPDVKLSVRGYGTEVRTDPVFIGLQKTRLLDPTLNLFGTNDHPGDFRSGGCSACHVVYANDRSPVHSGMWAKFGNLGHSSTKDPTIPKDQSAHPIEHKFAKSMPTSQCIVCHVHPGTNVLNSYLGFTWWDNESNGQLMYPKKQRYPTQDDEYRVGIHNPEGAAVRGLWSDIYPDAENQVGQKAGPAFLENIIRLNPSLKQMQFADFHGHGWVFRSVYKRDRHGNLLDKSGNVIKEVTADQLKQAVEYQWKQPGDALPANTPVHLKDIHLEKGMHCTDCHFAQDSHGNGHLYGETRNAVTVECIDCHGTVDEPAAILQFLNLTRRERGGDDGKRLLTAAFTGNAALKQPDAKELAARRQFIEARFDVKNGRLWQNSAINEKAGWEVVQTQDTILPQSWWATDRSTDAAAARRARFAHTVRRDGKMWGDLPKPGEAKRELQLAHANNSVSCYACHSAWNTSCFGCHLPQRANQRRPMLHNEGTVLRNYTNYNYQTVRADVYMLGIDSTVKGHKVVPVRSACAVLVSSQDANRQWLYTQQQTVSAEGLAGTSFSPYFPHTVRSAETKQCTDCHVSAAGDNNAIMAQLLMLGTKSVNFIGRFAWVGQGKGGLQAVAVTERDEPQAVIGSTLHQMAYPDYYNEHVRRGLRLTEAHTHEGEVLDVQLRGEYLYAACGREGFIAYDVANIDDKGFSERIITAPVSPLGQQFYVKSKYATSICSPSTMALDPTRPHLPENEEAGVPLLYAFLYLTDREEGLVVIGNPLDEKRNKPGVATLLDGIPDNNYLKRAATYNPGGLLKGARHMALYGSYAYICCDAGLVVLDMNNPLEPRHVTTVSVGELKGPRKVVFQFRYGFVCDQEGIKVIDVTWPERPRVVQGAAVPVADARDIYVCRTYGYVAAGKDGLLIVDLEKPEKPVLEQRFNAQGQINDATAVRVGMTNTSLFAYIADGRNGLRVVQLTSDQTPGYLGFSPRPQPRLIAQYKTRGPAIALSEGLDRDRAVDESGHQLAVFGRRGSRPFNLMEQQRMYLRTRPDGTAEVFTVENDPVNAPNAPATQPAAPPKTTPPPATQPGRRLPFRPR